MSEQQNPAAAAVQAVQQAKDGTQAPENQVPNQADPRLEQLTRKEKQLHALRKQIEDERKALQSREEEYKTNYIPKNRLTEDPLSVLNEAGISYDKLTEMLLSQPNADDPAIKTLLNKIKAIEDRQEQASKQAAEQTQKQYEQALNQIRNEVKLVVDSASEFETIKEMGMQDAVVELIEQTFTNEGYLMDIEKAAQEVENHLLEEAYKMAQLKKVQSRLQPKQEQNSPAPASKQNQAPGPIKTLTNSMQTQTTKGMTAKERRERAIAAFHGKLNQ